MPTVHIAQTGTVIAFPSTDAGRIRINARLHLSGQPSAPGIRIELSFKPDPFRRLFKRSDFWCRLRSYAQREAQKTPPLTREEQEDLDHFRPRLFNGSVEQSPPDDLLRQWGQDIANTLYQDFYADAFRRIALHGHPLSKGPSYRSLQTIDERFETVDYRLKIDREDLKSLRKVIATETGAKRLLFEVQWFLLPTCLIDYALRGLARGKKHPQDQHDLMYVVSCAVFVGEALVEQAKQDQTLRRRLHQVLQKEECGWQCRSAVQILTLADRALRPALEHYAVNSLIGRRISEVLKHDARQYFDKFFRILPERLDWWFELLLGPEGEASRQLRLTS